MINNYKLNIYDTHCHLFDEKIINEADEIIKECKKMGFGAIFMPCIDYYSLKPLFDLISKYPNFLYGMIGMHPLSIDKNFESNLSYLKKFIDKPNICGIGEVGLDYYYTKKYKDEQKAALEIQIEWAILKNYPVIIHARNSLEDVLNIIGKYKKDNLRGIIHCFTGNLDEFREIQKLSFYVGIGGILTYGNSNLKDTIKEISLENIVLETDSPYLAPVPHRGKINKPQYIIHTAEKISKILNISLNSVLDITSQNVKKVFSI